MFPPSIWHPYSSRSGIISFHVLWAFLHDRIHSFSTGSFSMIPGRRKKRNCQRDLMNLLSEPFRTSGHHVGIKAFATSLSSETSPSRGTLWLCATPWYFGRLFLSQKGRRALGWEDVVQCCSDSAFRLRKTSLGFRVSESLGKTILQGVAFVRCNTWLFKKLIHRFRDCISVCQ